MFIKTGILGDESRLRLETLVDEVAQREQCRLYDLNFIGRNLRIFISRQDHQPVSIDNCTNISRSLSLLLDVEDVVPGGHYTLEVSSPGLERPLIRDWHFAEAVGEKVLLKLKKTMEATPVQGSLKGSIKGKLVGIADGVLEIEAGNGPNIRVAQGQIEKARTVFEFGAE